MAKKDKNFRIKNFKDEIDKYIKERVKEQTKDGINIKEYKEQIAIIRLTLFDFNFSFIFSFFPFFF